MLNVPCNQALTDSLSLKIKFSDCEVIDERLTSMTCIYYESLDAIDCELHPPKPIVIEQNGITVRISLVDIPIYNSETNTKQNTKFINLTLSAKLLKHNYFNGITKQNIQYFHDEFMRMNIFKCTLDTFLDGMASDIDVCVNRYVFTAGNFADILSYIYSSTGPKQKHCHFVQQSENIGLSMNKRNTAKPSLPFCKFYFKEFELFTKSVEFYNLYLAKIWNVRGLSRVECTIKNYEHKRRLERFKILPMFKTLREYLEIPQQDLYNFVCFSLQSYLTVQKRVKSPNLSPTEHIIFELIQTSVLNGADFKQILEIANTFHGRTPGVTDVSRTRIRKKLTELYDLLIHQDKITNKKLNANKLLNDYLRVFKIDNITPF